MLNGYGIRCFIAVSIALMAVSCTTPDKHPPEKKQTANAFSPLDIYQKYISPVDGDRCRMIPSCSQYAKDAINTHGILLGWIMSCDRLLRCGGDEFYISQPIVKGNRRYCSDPVSVNDFWWSFNDSIGDTQPE